MTSIGMHIPHIKQAGQFFVMLKYKLHTFTLTSSHMTWVHITSIQLQSTKILIIIYIKNLNLDMQVYYCMTHPQSFHTIAQRELIGQLEKKNLDNGDKKT